MSFYGYFQERRKGMGFLDRLLKRKINETIDRAVENVLKTESEREEQDEVKTTEAKAAQTDYAEVQNCDGTDESKKYMCNGFEKFPAWKFSPVFECSTNESDEFKAVIITVDLTDDLVDRYMDVLAGEGFSGDFQLQKKIIDGMDYIVDFSFVPEKQIQYLIRKNN